jgi:hypothetical protein
MLLSVVVGIALFWLQGCATEQPQPPGALVCPAPPKPVTGWGQFQGTPMRTEWREDGRCMTLLADVHYIDKRGHDWIAPKGDKIDGASIPKALWSVIGGPYEGLYRDASVFHDVECARPVHTATWQETHRMFLESMLCNGVEERRAKTMYAAVYRFGPKWEPPQPIGPLGSLMSVTVKRPRGEPSETEIRRIERWIKRDNPRPEEIDRVMETGQIPST